MPTSIPSGRRTCTPSRASSGTRRCDSARPSPLTSSPRNSAPSASSWSLSSLRWRMRGRRTLRITWTSTAGSTSRATPTATRPESTPKSRSSISAPSRICCAAAWRDTGKELFEGEEEAVAKQEAKLEYAAGLEDVNEDLSILSEKETEFLPITTKAYLYLSGTPFKALATGEFIEEQIFNWTYTDEQRAKEEFATKNPGKWNPYGALPQMRLLTYQMPDELVAIASAGEFDEFDLNAFFEAKGTSKDAKFKHNNDVQKWLDIIRG